MRIELTTSNLRGWHSATELPVGVLRDPTRTDTVGDLKPPPPTIGLRAHLALPAGIELASSGFGYQRASTTPREYLTPHAGVEPALSA